MEIKLTLEQSILQEYTTIPTQRGQVLYNDHTIISVIGKVPKQKITIPQVIQECIECSISTFTGLVSALVVRTSVITFYLKDGDVMVLSVPSVIKMKSLGIGMLIETEKGLVSLLHPHEPLQPVLFSTRQEVHVDNAKEYGSVRHVHVDEKDGYVVMFEIHTRVMSVFKYHLTNKETGYGDVNVLPLDYSQYTFELVLQVGLSSDPHHIFVQGQMVWVVTRMDRKLKAFTLYSGNNAPGSDFNNAPVYEFDVLNAVSVNSNVLLLTPQHELRLWIGDDQYIPVSLKQTKTTMKRKHSSPRPRVVDIQPSRGGEIVFVFSDFQKFKSTIPEICSGLVKKCLKALEYALPHHYKQFLVRYFSLLEKWSVEWDSFVICLFSFFPVCLKTEDGTQEEGNDWDWVEANLLQQNSQLPNCIQKLFAKPKAKGRFETLVKQSEGFRTTSFLTEFSRDIIISLHFVYEDLNLDVGCHSMAQQLGSLLVHFAHMVKSNLREEYLDDGMELVVDVGLDGFECDLIELERMGDWVLKCIASKIPPPSILNILDSIGKRNQTLMSGCTTLVSVIELLKSVYTSSSEETVRKLVELKLDLKVLVPPLMVIIQHCLYYCRDHPNGITNSWEACMLVGRKDLATLIRPEPRSFTQSDITRLRFINDQRLKEVEQLLILTKEPTLEMEVNVGMPMEEIGQIQQAALKHWTKKSFSVAIGRGMLTFDSEVVVPTETVQVPNLIKSARMPPVNSLVELQVPEHSGLLDWPEFHLGVTTALQIRRDCKDVTSSWIVFNQTRGGDFVIDAKHAGFIFGLGLQGHLRKLESADSLRNYVSQMEIVSVGHLLGLAVAYVGTRHSKVTKMLSVHIPSMLPPNSAELDTSHILKSVSVVGFGLVHFKRPTQYKYDKLLMELKSQKWNDDAFLNAGCDTYLISLGFAIGLLGVGSLGSNETTEIIVTKLLHSLKTAEKVSAHMSVYVALGLLGLRTGDENLKRVLSIPTTMYDLELMTPEQLLVRAISLHLVKLNEIVPTMEYIQSQIPQIVQDSKDSDEHLLLTYLVLLTAFSFSIGLAHAGTCSSTAINTLVEVSQTFLQYLRCMMN